MPTDDIRQTLSRPSAGSGSAGGPVDSTRIGQVFLDIRDQRLHFLNSAARRLRSEGVPVSGEDLETSELQTQDGLRVRASRLPLVIAWREERSIEANFILLRDGKPDATICWSASPVRGPDGNLIGILGSFCSTPPQPNWRGMAESAHDLRTPLNALNLLSHHLSRPDLASADLQACLADVRAAVQRALAVSTDLLDMCRGPASQVHRVESSWFSLEELLTRIVRELRIEAEHKGLDLALDSADATSWQVFSDPTRFGRILSNLIENAIRYTPAGSVRCTTAWRSEAMGSQTLVISIVDTGSGIPAEEKQDVFKPFERGQAGKQSDSDGHGLGLTVVDHLVSELELEFEVESESGRGSAFRLLVPPRLLRLAATADTGTLVTAPTKHDLRPKRT
jgi:two-component sensor histidine kinase